MARAFQRIVSQYKIASNADLLRTTNVSKNQVAGLIAKHMRDENYERPRPFPYKTDAYKFWNTVFDKTSWRFDENTKLIVVEGPINSGKENLAKKIADHYDLLYVPNVNMDIMYKNKYGYHRKVVDDQLPKRLRTFDIHEFLANPVDERTALMQLDLFKARIYQYIDTLLHILSTGQGAVMNRNMYTEFIFMETFVKLGYLPKKMKRLHYQIRTNMMNYLMRPHLYVYLDCPVDVVLEKTKSTKNQVEINSPVLKPQALQFMEGQYAKYLKSIGRHSELIRVDASKPVDYDKLFEDLDSVKLERDEFNFKMSDWFFVSEGFICRRRVELSGLRGKIMDAIEGPDYFDIPELWIDYQEKDAFLEVLNTIPGTKFAYGYNDDVGDFSLFKTKRNFTLLTHNVQPQQQQ